LNPFLCAATVVRGCWLLLMSMYGDVTYVLPRAWIIADRTLLASVMAFQSLIPSHASFV
jgi:hypothetical protein